MKYFKWETMYERAPENELEKGQYYQELKMLQEEHEIVFVNVQRAFSKTSLNNYEDSGRFHDYEIKDLAVFTNCKSKDYPRLEIIISLSGIGEYSIHYKGVSYFEIINEASDEHSKMVSKWDRFDTYLYDEFDVLENGYYQHEILLLTRTTLKIKFRKIIIEKKA